MVIHKLNAKRWVGHVEIYVHLFQHLGVFVRRPARPVTGLGDGESSNQSPCFDILGKQHVKLPRRSGSAGGEFKTGIG